MASSRHSALRRATSVLARHWKAFVYILTIILPMIVRQRRRPVLFARQTGLGDIICTIPASRELMKRHPGATFIYNCHESFAPVPIEGGVADRVTSLEPIGLVGHWYRFLLAGYYPFTHLDDRPEHTSQEPMVAEFCRQFGLPVTEEHPQLKIAPAAREKVIPILKQKGLDPSVLVLIHPGPSWTVKEWPRERWAALVAELRSRGWTNIAQLGVGRYMNFGQVAVEPIPGTISLVDALSVEECIAVIAQARLLVGIDSGLLHIAAATRTPSIGIFGPTLPKYLYAEKIREPFAVSQVDCAGCQHRLPRLHWITGCPYDIKCMKTLGVGEILQRCLVQLGASPK